RRGAPPGRRPLPVLRALAPRPATVRRAPARRLRASGAGRLLPAPGARRDLPRRGRLDPVQPLPGPGGGRAPGARRLARPDRARTPLRRPDGRRVRTHGRAPRATWPYGARGSVRECRAHPVDPETVL